MFLLSHKCNVGNEPFEVFSPFPSIHRVNIECRRKEPEFPMNPPQFNPVVMYSNILNLMYLFEILYKENSTKTMKTWRTIMRDQLHFITKRS